MKALPENPSDAVRELADEIKRLNGKVAALEAYVASIHGTVTRDPAALRRFAESCCNEEAGAAAADTDWARQTLDTLMKNRWCDTKR
jgi:hypothetical protein